MGSTKFDERVNIVTLIAGMGILGGGALFFLSTCQHDEKLEVNYNGEYNGYIRDGKLTSIVDIIERDSSIKLVVYDDTMNLCYDGSITVTYFGEIYDIWGDGECQEFDYKSGHKTFKLRYEYDDGTVVLKGKFLEKDEVQVSIFGVGRMWLHKVTE